MGVTTRVLQVAAVVALASCGGSDAAPVDSEAPASTSAPETTEPPPSAPDPTTTTSTATIEEPTAETSDPPSESASDSPGSATEDQPQDEVVDTFVPDVSGVPDPLFDPFFAEAETVRRDIPSLDGLKVYLDLEYPDAAWRRAIATGPFSLGGPTAGTGVPWTIAAADFAGTDPVVVCEAAMTYLRPLDPSASLVVATLDADFAETPVAGADAGGDCAPR